MQFVNFHKTWILLALLIVMSSVAACKQDQSKSAESLPTAVPDSVKNVVAATSKQLAEIDQKDSAAPDKHAEEVAKAGTHNQLVTVYVARNGHGAAYVAKVGNRMHVVHNGNPGKFYDSIESNNLAISPDGQRVAYPAKDGEQWVIIVNDEKVDSSKEGGSVAFSDDSRHVAYEVKSGDKWVLVVDGVKNSGAHSYYDAPMFVNNSSQLLYVEGTQQEGAGTFRLVLTDLQFRKSTLTTITNPSYLAVNAKKTTVAAIAKDLKKQRVISFSFAKPEIASAGEWYDEIICQPTLSSDGKLISYLAKRGEDTFVIFNDKVEKLPQGEYLQSPAIRPDGKGVAVVVSTPEGAYLHQVFYKDDIKHRMYKEVANIVYTGDGLRTAHLAIKNDKFLMVVNGVDGSEFDRVFAPKFSPDGKFLVYSARNGERRFVVVADQSGKIVRKSAEYDRVFETVFTDDGSSVAFGAMIGRKIFWQVEKLQQAK